MPAPRSNLIHALVGAMLGALMPSYQHMKQAAEAAVNPQPAIERGRPRKGGSHARPSGAAALKRASKRRRNIAKHNRSAAQ